MFSYIDPLLFPDEIDVLEISENRHILPIFKNGSSSLYRMNFKKVQNFQDLKEVEVLVRDPYERFVSGVNSYIKYLDPKYDKDTAQFFLKKYLFLDRHFCPQLFWLINLKRLASVNFKLLPFTEISTLTSYKINESKVNAQHLLPLDDKIKFYLQLDKPLFLDLINQTVSMNDIIDVLQTKYSDVYKEVIQRSKQLCNVLG
jgi:hypothetical protein